VGTSSSRDSIPFHSMVSRLERRNVLKFLSSVDVFVLDCDGVLWRSSHILPNIPETLIMLREMVVCVCVLCGVCSLPFLIHFSLFPSLSPFHPSLSFPLSFPLSPPPSSPSFSLLPSLSLSLSLYPFSKYSHVL